MHPTGRRPRALLARLRPGARDRAAAGGAGPGPRPGDDGRHLVGAAARVGEDLGPRLRPRPRDVAVRRRGCRARRARLPADHRLLLPQREVGQGAQADRGADHRRHQRRPRGHGATRPAAARRGREHDHPAARPLRPRRDEVADPRRRRRARPGLVVQRPLAPLRRPRRARRLLAQRRASRSPWSRRPVPRRTAAGSGRAPPPPAGPRATPSTWSASRTTCAAWSRWRCRRSGTAPPCARRPSRRAPTRRTNAPTRAPGTTRSATPGRARCTAAWPPSTPPPTPPSRRPTGSC